VYRLVEPHVLGEFDGKSQLLAYQIAGETTSGNLPNWRRVDIDRITNVAVLNTRFPGPRTSPGGPSSIFDKTIAVVE